MSGEELFDSSETKRLETPAAGSDTQPPRLRPGDDFGTRYRIIDILGEGGMGTVYRALDKELNREVALKLLKPSISGSPDALERFKREILLASKVTHKHVLRIHDLGDVGGLKYISMNYVEGEDLSEVIAREGALPAERVISLLKQLCLGLKAAHDEGVLHRDLKPQNVMVDKHDNVYITDFGLARSIDIQGGESLTATGVIVGTPMYMAPEQITGDALDKRTDLYSLGLIVYQMLTGELPFSNASNYESLLRRLKEKPRDVRQRNPSIPDYVARIVKKCMEADPHGRYQDAGEILADLETRRARHSSRQLLTRVTNWKAIAVLGLLVIAILAAWWAIQSRRGSFLQEPGAPPLGIIMLPFESDSRDASSEWMGLAIADLLALDLRESKSLRPVSGQRLSQILRGLQLPATGSRDPATLRHMAEFGSAGIVLTGRFSLDAGTMRVDVTLTDITGNRTYPIQVVAEREWSRIVNELSSRVRRYLPGATATPGDRFARTLANISTRSEEVLRSYYLGLEMVTVGDDENAAKLFEEAVTADPSFALAHVRLAQAYERMDNMEMAETQGQKALEQADELPLRELYQMQATQATLEGNQDAAIEATLRLVAAYAADSEAYLSLGSVYYANGDLDQALENYRKAFSLDPKSVYVVTALGRVELKKGNPHSALQYLTEARSYATQFQNDRERADLLNMLGVAYRRLDYNESALEHYQKSLELKTKLGDQKGIASTLSNMAIVYQDLGRYDEARRSYHQALDISREINDQATIGRLLNNLGSLAEKAGQYEEALDYYSQGLRIARTMGSQSITANRLNNIGWIYYLTGRFTDASTNYQLALQEIGDLPERLTRAGILYAHGTLLVDQGKYSQALDEYSDALQIWREAQDNRGLAYTMIDLGHTFNLLGAFQKSNEQFELAKRIADEMGDKEVLSHLHLYQGEMMRFRGDWGAAEQHLTEARRLAEESRNQPALIRAQIEQATLFGQQDTGERSLSALSEAHTRSRKLDLEPLLIRIRVEQARALAAQGRSVESLGMVRAALKMAEPLGVLETQLQAYGVAGRTCQMSRRLDPALDYYRHMLDIVAAIRKDVGKAYDATLLERKDLREFLDHASKAFTDAGRQKEFEPYAAWLKSTGP